MTFNQTCLLLGRFKDTVKLKKILSKKNCKVICKNTNVFLKDLKKIDLVVIFNYRHVLKKEILRNLKRPAINLHISYLPYNRGCHPNFWSFIENSPKGVTIHEVDKGLDTGPIIYRKKINFNFNKKKNDDFFKTNQILLFEIKKLFSEKIDQILNNKYLKKKQGKNGSFHYRSDLPDFMKNNWKIKIKKILKVYGQS